MLDQSPILLVFLSSSLSLLVGYILWKIKERYSDQEKREDKIHKLNKRMSDAEKDLDNLRDDMDNIEKSLQNLDESQSEIKEELTNKLGNLREEYSAVKQDIKWIRHFLEKEGRD